MFIKTILLSFAIRFGFHIRLIYCFMAKLVFEIFSQGGGRLLTLPIHRQNLRHPLWFDLGGPF